MNGGIFMKDFNTYEKALIKNRINPSVCLMSTGVDWMYISNLKAIHYADITVIGNDPKLINEYDILKDYDILILDSMKDFKNEILDDLVSVAGEVSNKYDKNVAMIYSFLRDNRKVAVKFISDKYGFDELGIIDGTIDLRTMLDEAYKVLNPVKVKKKKKSK